MLEKAHNKPLKKSFRPLPGYLISQLSSAKDKSIFLPFPSPSGVSHFSMIATTSGTPSSISFRPLPGYLISQSCFYSSEFILSSFPSPSGVSHFSIGVCFLGEVTVVKFPSPSGVSHFSISCIRNEKPLLIIVSVPFRGISFLNGIVTVLPSPNMSVSVPFRGISFLNIFNVQHGLFAVCFRPLPGYLISQSDCTLHCQVCLTFPSPSGVSHFSIVSVKSMPRASRTRFRPLPGYLISQC